uniref:Uncharacterized protein n=1 Tax=Hyaloperonospora arabidopsidis (strain Emoy2) TaxID=559515 RepID=M4B1I9_HYAAE
MSVCDTIKMSLEAAAIELGAFTQLRCVDGHRQTTSTANSTAANFRCHCLRRQGHQE